MLEAPTGTYCEAWSGHVLSPFWRQLTYKGHLYLHQGEPWVDSPMFTVCLKSDIICLRCLLSIQNLHFPSFSILSLLFLLDPCSSSLFGNFSYVWILGSFPWVFTVYHFCCQWFTYTGCSYRLEDRILLLFAVLFLKSRTKRHIKVWGLLSPDRRGDRLATRCMPWPRMGLSSTKGSWMSWGRGWEGQQPVRGGSGRGSGLSYPAGYGNGLQKMR